MYGGQNLRCVCLTRNVSWMGASRSGICLMTPAMWRFVHVCRQIAWMSWSVRFVCGCTDVTSQFISIWPEMAKRMNYYCGVCFARETHMGRWVRERNVFYEGTQWLGESEWTDEESRARKHCYTHTEHHPSTTELMCTHSKQPWRTHMVAQHKHHDATLG